jgi:hypothetical protein
MPALVDFMSQTHHIWWRVLAVGELMRFFGVFATRSLAALAIAGLAGCSDYRSLPQYDPYMHSQDFQVLLAREYADYARSEAEQYDWKTADYFARKSHNARAGKQVLPEDPDVLKVPARHRAMAKTYRERLLAQLARKNTLPDPVLLARTQMLYDCWIEQLHENWQAEDIFACREEFFFNIQRLEAYE